MWLVNYETLCIAESNFYLDIVSYNMHGFNQGVSTVRDMALSDHKKIFLLQEHWLSPFNLYKFNDNFSGVFMLWFISHELLH